MSLIKIVTHNELGEDLVNPDAIQTLRWFYRSHHKVNRDGTLTDQFSRWEFCLDLEIGGRKYDLCDDRAREAYKALFSKDAPPAPSRSAAPSHH